MSSGQDGSGSGIYAQRYDAQGVPQGGEFRVNSTTSGDQRYSSVAMDDILTIIARGPAELFGYRGWGRLAKLLGRV